MRSYLFWVSSREERAAGAASLTLKDVQWSGAGGVALHPNKPFWTKTLCFGNRISWFSTPGAASATIGALLARRRSERALLSLLPEWNLCRQPLERLTA